MKKSEISNKTLTLLLVATIVISLGGTLISLTKLGKGITGLATDSGQVNVTIYEDITISMISSTINFGSGVVSSGSDSATLDSATGSTTNGNWSFSSQNLTFQNDGNVDINVTVASGKNSSDYLCSGDSDCDQAGAATYKFKTIAGHNCGTNQSSYTSFTKSNQSVCTNLDALNSADDSGIAIELTVPGDAHGAKTDTLTFISTASS